ncbi:glycine-rich domain-containing protein [Legionella clemsonensis]|uniref:Uncharacterized protein n=1 Tax=Legionella clemsonensis TaxID=1867846 RepID=A0A222P0A2_9GAMM|nr:hypothetical protein clem_03595 [Legionella clemsonensis]
MKLPPLQDLLAYENEQVVRYFCHYYTAFSHEEGQQLLSDLLAWLWLNAYRKTYNKSTYLFGPLLTLDKIWHAFILHTEDYVAFCEHYFGHYFHHNIEPVGSEHELSPEELADFLNDAFEWIGQEWIKRHFGQLLNEI